MMRFFSKLISKIYIPWKREVSFEEMQVFNRLNLRGAVLLTHSPYQLGNLFISGYYGHAEIIVGPNASVAARTDGVHLKKISDVISKCDCYTILLPHDTKQDDRNRVSTLAIELSNKNIPYDFDMSLINNAMYCSEFVVYCYNQVVSEDLAYGKYILPNEIYKDRRRWTVIHLFKYKR